MIVEHAMLMDGAVLTQSHRGHAEVGGRLGAAVLDTAAAWMLVAVVAVVCCEAEVR
jgi:hypothetical protein